MATYAPITQIRQINYYFTEQSSLDDRNANLPDLKFYLISVLKSLRTGKASGPHATNKS